MGFGTMTEKRNLFLEAWNGPFSLGPLTKPVALVDVFMKILELIWKLGFCVISAYIVIIPIAFILFKAGLIK